MSPGDASVEEILLVCCSPRLYHKRSVTLLKTKTLKGGPERHRDVDFERKWPTRSKGFPEALVGRGLQAKPPYCGANEHTG